VVREASPSGSSDASLRDAFPDSKESPTKTSLFAGGPTVTFDWRVQVQRQLPPENFISLQYHNKKALLQPFPCANDFSSQADHLKSLTDFYQHQLTAGRKDPRDHDHSYLRGTVLSQLRAEIFATLQFIRKILHRSVQPPLPQHLHQQLEFVSRELGDKLHTLRVLAHKIFDRAPPRINPDLPHIPLLPLSSSSVGEEKDAICGAVRVIWEVEEPIRAYLAPFLRQQQVREAGPQLQANFDLQQNQEAKEAFLQLHPQADLGPE